MLNEFDDMQMIQIFAVVTFISMFLALFIYFAVFPVKASGSIEFVEKTIIGVDPIAFEIAKTWNNLNQHQTVIGIDSCNTATRIDESTWQITMKNC